MPPNSLAFGVGCFHFGLNRSAPFDFDGKTYLTELEASLRSINNVKSVEIKYSDQLRATKLHIEHPHEQIGEGTNWFPYWGYMLVRFELHIPSRVQAELAGVENESALETFTEDFRVDIKHVYHSPVAIIRPIDPKGKCRPSQGVEVVRKLLEVEFGRTGTNGTRFEYLGPSPFHADFYIEFSPDTGFKSAAFKAFRTPSLGYAETTFYADPNLFDTLEEAEHALLSEIGSEFDLFYYSEQMRIEEMNSWQEVEAKVRGLVQAQRPSAFWKRVRQAFRLPRLLSEAYAGILEFEALSLMNGDDWQRSFNSTYSPERDGYIKDLVLLSEKDHYKCPVQQRMSLLTFLESRRLQHTQNFIVLTSALLGGVAGSVITLALSK